MTLPEIPESQSLPNRTHWMMLPGERHAINSELTERPDIDAEPVVPVTVVASN